jgi:hypothetical protein
MNSIKHIAIEEFKRCAAKSCTNPGTYEMEIVFLGKKGWFCEQCKDSLMGDGLLLQQQGVDSILNNQTTKMGKDVSGDQPTDATPTHSTDRETQQPTKEVIGP